MATALAAVGALVMSGGLVMLGASPAANANGQDHVFVCKYVGQPGVDEVLKEGKQPIRVGAPATTDDGWFNDGQGWSYVLDVSTPQNTGSGNEYLGSASCDGVLIPLPPVPGVDDPCGPANATWVKPADSELFAWAVVDGHLIVTIRVDSKFFSDHTRTHDYGVAPDSGRPCDTTVTIDPPSAPATTDPCGPANISFVVPADTAQLDYTLLGNGNVTVAPEPGYVFSGNSQLITFTLPADSNVPCDTTVTIAPPGAPPTIDPCDPGNIRFDVPADTATLNYELLANGNVTVAPQAGYVFSGPTQLVTFILPADSGVLCPLGVEEIAPEITFTDPDCANLDGADWSGNLKEIVAYEVTGTPGLGESITVTASIKPALADQYAFPEGFDATVDHTYPTLAELDCVLGEETVVPSPKPEQNPPVVLGTEAAVPTRVNAGMASLPGTGTSTNALLAQLLVGTGLILLVAGGWVGFAGRDYGRHHI